MLVEEYFDVNKEKYGKVNQDYFKEIRLEKIIARTLQITEEVKDDFIMQESPLWDSLKQMELIAALEAAYETRFTVDEIVEMYSVKDIKNIILTRLSK